MIQPADSLHLAGSVVSSNTTQAAGQTKDLTAAPCSQTPPSGQVPLSPGVAAPSLSSRRPSHLRTHRTAHAQGNSPPRHRSGKVLLLVLGGSLSVAQSSPTARSLQPSAPLALTGMFSVLQVHCS